MKSFMAFRVTTRIIQILHQEFSSDYEFLKFVPRLVYWLVGCTFESNCLLVGPGTVGGMPSVGFFLRILARIYASFGENYRYYLSVSCRIESNCPLVGPGTVGGMPSVGGLSKAS